MLKNHNAWYIILKQFYLHLFTFAHWVRSSLSPRKLKRLMTFVVTLFKSKLSSYTALHHKIQRNFQVRNQNVQSCGIVQILDLI